MPEFTWARIPVPAAPVVAVVNVIEPLLILTAFGIRIESAEAVAPDVFTYLT